MTLRATSGGPQDEGPPPHRRPVLGLVASSQIANASSGLDVLVAPARSEGFEVPATFAVATPSGGMHLYFVHRWARDGSDSQLVL
jgi:hypothetical protein